MIKIICNILFLTLSLSWSQTTWAAGQKRNQSEANLEGRASKKTFWASMVTPESFTNKPGKSPKAKASKIKISTSKSANKLFMAIRHQDGQWAVETYLKSYEAPLLIRDPQSNNTALHEAAKFQYRPEIIETLLASRYAAVLVQPNKAGNTPLHTAIKNENWHAVSLLLHSNYASKLLAPNKLGDTPLHVLAHRIALQGGDWETVKEKIGGAYGPRLFYAKNQNNETAIELFYRIKPFSIRLPENLETHDTKDRTSILLHPNSSDNYSSMSLSSPQNQDTTISISSTDNNNTQLSLIESSNSLSNNSPIIEAPSPQLSNLTNKKRQNKTPLHCIIDKKYITQTYTSLPLTRTNNNNNSLRNFSNFSLSTLADHHNSQPKDVYEHVIVPNQLSLLSTNRAPIQNHERITFVRVGRNDQALVPREKLGGRIILVFAQAEQDSAYNFMSDKQDVLLIHSLPKIEDKNDLVLAGARWLALFIAAYELKLDNFMIMDDNIQSIHVKNTELAHWEDIYNIYKKASLIDNYAIVSSSSFRPEQNENLSHSNTLEIITNNYGYKVFYINNTLLRNAIPNYLHIIPEDPRWPLQDIFLQEVARQAGLKIGKISPNSLVLKRSYFNKNTCANSYKKRKISAETWLEVDLASYLPDFYKNAYHSMKLIVEKSLNHYKKNEDKVKNTLLADASRRLENNSKPCTSVIPHNESRTKYSPSNQPKKNPQYISDIIKNNTNIKSLILETLEDIFGDEHNFAKLRSPQQEALFALSTFLSDADSFQGFFDIATGIGKTGIFTLLANKLRHQLEKNQIRPNKPHILIVTPSLEIDRQTFNESLLKTNTIVIDAHHISYRILLENNLFNQNNATPQIVIMCKNSLSQLLSDGDNNQLLNKFSAIIFDEMHSFSPKILKVIKDYSDKSNTLMLGFSATPQKTKQYFGTEPIFRYTPHQGVNEGYLLPWDIRTIKDNTFTDINSTKNTVKNILDELFNDHNKDRRGIIWVDTIDAANILAQFITTSMHSQNIKAHSYHSLLSMEQRASLVEELNTGATNLLVAVRTLKEGLNCPAVNVVIFAKKKITMQDFIQMRGRALRKTLGPQENALIYLNKKTLTSYDDEEIYYTMPVEQTLPTDKPPVLDPALWKVVPFPIHTDLEKALRYSVRFYRQDALYQIFKTIHYSIYKSDNYKIEREKMRWKTNYSTNDSDLNKLYRQYFIVQSDDNSNNPIPAAHIYEEKYNDGDNIMRYHYIETIGQNGEERPLHILKKKREAINNATNQTVWLDHYELIHNFGDGE